MKRNKEEKNVDEITKKEARKGRRKTERNRVSIK
jgi:hypothetical protein